MDNSYIPESGWWMTSCYMMDNMHACDPDMANFCCCANTTTWDAILDECVACRGDECHGKVPIDGSNTWWTPCVFGTNLYQCYLPLEHSGAFDQHCCCYPGHRFEGGGLSFWLFSQFIPYSNPCVEDAFAQDTVIEGSDSWIRCSRGTYRCSAWGTVPDNTWGTSWSNFGIGLWWCVLNLCVCGCICSPCIGCYVALQVKYGEFRGASKPYNWSHSSSSSSDSDWPDDSWDRRQQYQNSNVPHGAGGETTPFLLNSNLQKVEPVPFAQVVQAAQQQEQVGQQGEALPASAYTVPTTMKIQSASSPPAAAEALPASAYAVPAQVPIQSMTAAAPSEALPASAYAMPGQAPVAIQTVRAGSLAAPAAPLPASAYQAPSAAGVPGQAPVAIQSVRQA